MSLNFISGKGPCLYVTGKQRLSERKGVFGLLPCRSTAGGVPCPPACTDGGPGGAHTVMRSQHTLTAPSGGKKPQIHASCASSSTSVVPSPKDGETQTTHGLTTLGSGSVPDFMFWTSWDKRHRCFPPCLSPVRSCKEKYAQNVLARSKGRNVAWRTCRKGLASS